MSHDTTVQQAAQSAPSGGGHHAADAGHEAPIKGGDVFTHLISELGDHHELNIFFGHFDVLPVILVDDGLHVYANTHAMEEAGAYTLHHPDGHHKIVSTTKVDAAGHPVAPALDLSITNLVAYQILAVLVVTAILAAIRGKYVRDPKAPPTGLQNMIESVVVYVRDQVVLPNVGTTSRANRLMPYFTALFFFILVLNLIGLLPGAHAATGALGVTCGLALTSFFVTNYIAMKDAGVGSWLHHLLGGAPVFLAPIMVPIELIGLFTKPFALTIRLFANMTAGHIVILSLLGLIFFFESWGVVPVSIAFSLFIYILELLVAFLQAYIFATLSAVFVGLALGDHAKDDHHAHAH